VVILVTRILGVGLLRCRRVPKLSAARPWVRLAAKISPGGK